MKSVMLAKAKKMPVGTIRKYGASFYKKITNKGWQRVPTKEGRITFEKQEAKGKVGVKKVGEKREFQAWKMTRKELSTTISIKELNNIECKINKEKFNWYEDRPLMNADVRMSDFHKEAIKRAISEGKIIPEKVLKDYPDFMETRAKGEKRKIGIKPKKLKLAEKPVKKKAQIKKTPTKINGKTKISKYTDQIKNISIMNESGKKSYIKLIKEAIRNKDKAMLDYYLKEVKNWVERNKKFQERKMLRKAKYVKRTGSPGSYKYWYKDEKGRIVEKEKPSVGVKREVPSTGSFTKDKVIAVSTVNKNVKYYNINGTVWRIASTGAKVNEGNVKEFSKYLKEGKRYKAKAVGKELPEEKPKKEVKEKEEKPQDNKKLNAIRSIVNSKQHGKIEGQSLDLQTANLLVAVADNLSDKNKKVFLNMPVTRMVDIADKLRKKGAIK